MSPANRNNRVDDDLRRDAFSLVGTHYAEGRLDAREYQRRLNTVAHARRSAEIRTAFADLPRPHPDFGPLTARPHRGVFGVLAVCLLLCGVPATAVIGFSTGAWWPLLATTTGFVLGFGTDSRLAVRVLRRRPRERRDASAAGRIRLATADRELAVPELNHHLDVGHLGLTEFEDRMARLPDLTTRADMDRFFADLPAPHPNLAHLLPPQAAETRDARSSASTSIGFVDALGVAFLVVGIPAAVMVWIRTGQWYWLPAATVAVLVCFGSERASSRTGTRGAEQDSPEQRAGTGEGTSNES